MKKFKIILSLVLSIMIVSLSVLVSACQNNTETTLSSQTETITETVTEKETEKTETTVSIETEKTETTMEETETTESETTAKEEDPILSDDSLLAYYTFDSIDDGLVKDMSGNGYDCKVYGNPEIVTLDSNNKAIYLKDGGDNLYVDDHQNFNFMPNESFSLRVRLKWDGRIYDTWPCIINKGLRTNLGKQQYYGFWLDPNGKPALGCTNIYGNGTSNMFADYKLDTGWHTFVCIQDGEAQMIYFIIDDEVIASRQSCKVKTDVGMYIGINGNTSTEGQFLGMIDSVELYSKALSMSGYKVNGIDCLDYGKYDYTNESNERMVLPYRIYYPSDYSESDKKYPIILFMHGYGEIGTDNHSQLRITTNQEENKLLTGILERDDCIILVPQCTDPPKYNWVPLNHVWSTGARQNYTEKPTIALEAAQSLFMKIIEDEKVDKDRLYIAGISMGGYATWELLARNPSLFAAAIPICGGGILSSAESLKDTPIWAFHGESDGTVPPSGTKLMVEALKKAGSDKVKATYFPGVGHNCWNNVFATPGVIDWLFSQSK